MPKLNFKSTADIKISDKIADQVVGQEDAVEVIKKAAQQRRHVLLIGEPGTGKCVGASSNILTEQGPVPAAKLYEDLRSYTELRQDGEYALPKKKLNLYSISAQGKLEKQPVVALYKGRRKKGLQIKTASGEDIIVTGAHPVLSIAKNGQMVFRPAEEICEGSQIALLRKLPKFTPTKITIPHHRYLHQVKDRWHYKSSNGITSSSIKLPPILNRNLGYFLGVYVAEGRWQGNIHISNNNEKIKQTLIRILREEFDYDDSLLKITENGLYIRKSKALIIYLEQAFGIPTNVKGPKQSELKKVPSIIFRSSDEVIGAFLSGYIDGDGHINHKEFECSSVSKQLIKDVKTLFLRFSIHSRARVKFIKNKPYYTLCISDSPNINKLKDILNLNIDYKADALKSWKITKSNTNIDIIPGAGSLIHAINEDLGLRKDLLGHFPNTVVRCAKEKRNMSRTTAQELSRTLQSHIERSSLIQTTELLDRLHTIAHSDIFWDRVKTIDLVEEDMYDFEVENRHNFIANNIVVHNSMLGMALAEILPKEKLKDIISFPNPNDENNPLIRTMPGGKGRELVQRAKLQGNAMLKNQNIIMFILLIVAMIAPWWARSYYNSDIIFAALFLGGMVFLASFVLFINLGKRPGMQGQSQSPKVIVDNFKKKQVPFLDATGAHAGALLGDVLHDPFQSGGLGTPAHERVVAGMIHKGDMGVLFIDEIATLQPHTQQELLTALQEGKYPITGQSERSAGAMVRTEPVPCKFILVAAGNLETIKKMHPALRSRIRGYGYEVYMKDTNKDVELSRYKIAQFVAQEVKKDGKIPHFSKEAVIQIIEEAKKMANRKGHLTLRLRELGGLIRASGDVAIEQKAKLVEKKHINQAQKIARPLEKQLADKYIERKKEYEVIITTGKQVGRVNGLAVMGTDAALSGIILPIEAAVTPGGKEKEMIATGKLGEIAKEAIKNVCE